MIVSFGPLDADACLAAQFGNLLTHAAGFDRKRKIPPLSPQRAREARDRHEAWVARHNAPEKRIVGFPGAMRDVGGELTEAEHAALWAFFDGDLRRPLFTEMVRICSRGECFDRPQ